MDPRGFPAKKLIPSTVPIPEDNREKFDLYFQWGKRYRQFGDFQFAIICYNKALTIFSSEPSSDRFPPFEKRRILYQRSECHLKDHAFFDRTAISVFKEAFDNINSFSDGDKSYQALIADPRTPLGKRFRERQPVDDEAAVNADEIAQFLKNRQLAELKKAVAAQTLHHADSLALVILRENHTLMFDVALKYIVGKHEYQTTLWQYCCPGINSQYAVTMLYPIEGMQALWQVIPVAERLNALLRIKNVLEAFPEYHDTKKHLGAMLIELQNHYLTVAKDFEKRQQFPEAIANVTNALTVNNLVQYPRDWGLIFRTTLNLHRADLHIQFREGGYALDDIHAAEQADDKFRVASKAALIAYHRGRVFLLIGNHELAIETFVSGIKSELTYTGKAAYFEDERVIRSIYAALNQEELHAVAPGTACSAVIELLQFINDSFTATVTTIGEVCLELAHLDPENKRRHLAQGIKKLKDGSRFFDATMSAYYLMELYRASGKETEVAKISKQCPDASKAMESCHFDADNTNTAFAEYLLRKRLARGAKPAPDKVRKPIAVAAGAASDAASAGAAAGKSEQSVEEIEKQQAGLLLDQFEAEARGEAVDIDSYIPPENLQEALCQVVLERAKASPAPITYLKRAIAARGAEQPMIHLAQILKATLFDESAEVKIIKAEIERYEQARHRAVGAPASAGASASKDAHVKVAAKK